MCAHACARSAVEENKIYTEVNMSNCKELALSFKRILKIANLDNLLRLYSTLQLQSSDSIDVVSDNRVNPPLLTLRNIETSYSNIFEISTSALYDSNGIIPSYITVPQNKNFLLYIKNDDITNLILPDDDKLTVVIVEDLAYKQSMDIIVDADLSATQNKKLNIVIDYRYGDTSNLPVESPLVTNLDLPIYFNSVTQLQNSAYTWTSMKFEIDLGRSLQLNTGGILEVPLQENGSLVYNSFKKGDTLQLRDFTVGTVSLFDFSGQYTIDSVGLTNSYLYLSVNNNPSLISYGSTASNITNGGLPLPFNSSSLGYLLANKPYLDLNKGYKFRVTRVSDSDTSDMVERYMVEKIEL
jgi:hypothetical protein